MKLQEALRAAPIVAILRGVTPLEVEDVAAALADAGLRAIEVPLNSPDPLQSIARLRARFGDALCLGAGTVLTAEEVAGVAGAGGRLIVTPNTDEAVIAAACARGLDVAPGFATATEAFAALRAGARFLKLFPASTYGPAHLEALAAVLPRDVDVLAVGGVGVGDFARWRKAGARGFGLGSALYKPGMSASACGALARSALSGL
jgi:2-dehydro-3-deoxyphosphogalactonate aldolase